ncbi:MAG: hypothetical protein QM487_04060 [Candidatus Marithrix sp.]
MKILNGLELPEGTRWPNKLSYRAVRQSVATTISSNPVVTAQKLSKGQPINLEFGEQRAWLTYAQVQMIMKWAVIPGDTFVLQWNTEMHVVIFDSYEFLPIVDYDEVENDLYYGTINLITV